MQVLVNLGKLLEGEEESKKDDIVKGLHDESGSLYKPRLLVVVLKVTIVILRQKKSEKVEGSKYIVEGKIS